MIRLTDTVKHLLIINALFFVATLMNEGLMDSLFALWFPENPHFRAWQVVTHMFMHSGFEHIFFNMFNLYIFGCLIENYLGRNRFLFLYFSAGIAAAGLQLFFNYLDFHSAYQACLDLGVSKIDMDLMIKNMLNDPNHYIYYEGIPRGVSEKLTDSFGGPMLGASGAVFGVMAAAAILHPNLPLYLFFIPIPIKAKYLIGFYFVLELYSAITKDPIIGPSNVAFWAHVGGAIVGFITMWYWKKNQFDSNRWN